ncbi:vitronectin isoform 2-T2 [Discoglossus pictus]
MKVFLLPALLLGVLIAAKADEESCSGRCYLGFDAKKKCQCDTLCVYYKSCCNDYMSICKPIQTRGDIFTVPEDYNYEDFTDINELRPEASEVQVTTAPGMEVTKTIASVTTEDVIDATESEPTSQTAEFEDNTPESSTDVEELCSGKTFDAFTKLKNGSIYAFRGRHYYELDENSALDGYPRLIKDLWGIEGPIDAAFTRMNCQGKTYLFKDSKYWRFSDGVLDTGYPREISDGFTNIPDSIDAAFALPANNYKGREKVYFFKGNRYWQYEFKNQPSWEECQGTAPSEIFRRYARLQMDSWEEFFDLLFGSGKKSNTEGPRYISRDWKGVPSGVDAVMPSRIYVPQQTKSPLRLSRRRKSRRREKSRRKFIWYLTMDDLFFDDTLDDEESDPDWLPWPSCKPIQSVYFFKKDKYYRVNLQTKRVDKVYPRYPRPIAPNWLGCKEPSKRNKSKG